MRPDKSSMTAADESAFTTGGQGDVFIFSGSRLFARSYSAHFTGGRYLPGEDDDRSAANRAGQIADALNAAIENEEHPWVGPGPTVEEAGGESILIRLGNLDGDLHRGQWKARVEGEERDGWVTNGVQVPWRGFPEWTPVGWRRMPKAGTASE